MKTRITRLGALALLTILVCSLALPAAAAKEEVTINVYNWGQYISDGSDDCIDVNAAFTEETGIKVNYMTYDSNETMYTKLKTGGSAYDVIIPSDYMVARLIREGMLAEIDYDNIPNYQYVGEEYRNTAYDPDNKYSVPYTWGMVGLIYNTKHVDAADVGSWDLLWNEKYKGKILMFDNPRDAFGIAELRLGYDLNTESTQELTAAADLLVTQKPLVQDYVMDQIFAKMERGEAWIAPYYAGDYLLMVQENENLAFNFPSEGFNLFIDAMCIPASSQNKEAAEAYINFLCRPDISGQNLDYLGYSTPITGAADYMDPELASSPIAYPDAETLSRGHSFLTLSAEATQHMDSQWLRVKTDGGNSALIIGAIGLVVVAAALLFVFLRRKQKKAKRRATYQM